MDSAVSLLTLAELRLGHKTGLELVESSFGLLHRGTVYMRLHRLEAQGLVFAWEVAGRFGHTLRRYSLTDRGAEQLARYGAKP